MGRGRMKKTWRASIFLLLVCLLISGCWDRRELQERLFVLAIGIDAAKQEDAGKESSFVQAYGDKRYRISFQIMDIEPSAGDEGGRGKAKTNTYVVSETGQSINETVRAMIQQVNRNLWFDNVQAVIISQEALQQGGLSPIMDYIVRDKEFRWLIKVFITTGEAVKILEYKPPSGMPGGMFIEEIVDLNGRNPHVEGRYLDVKQYDESKENHEVFGFPRIELQGDIIKVKGFAALDRQEKLTGFLDEYAVKGGNLMDGNFKSGIITFSCPEHPEGVIALQVRRNQVKLTSYVKGNKIYYRMQSVIRGDIGEVQCIAAHDTTKKEYLQALEHLAEEEIRRNVAYTFRQYQRIGWDHNLFSRVLKRQYPLEWEKLKDNWFNGVFSETQLEVDAQVHIDNIGNHK